MLSSALDVAAALWAATNSSFPEEFGRPMDFRREAFVHGAIERGLLKNLPLRMIGRQGDMNF